MSACLMIPFIVATCLFPMLSQFYCSVCVHNNTRKQKNGEKRGRPGLIHHVSGHKVDIGREDPIFRYVHTSLKESFLPVKMSSFDHMNV